MRKSQISASMMCSNLVDLQATIDVFEKEKVEYLHIDVMDGEFVPNFGLGVDYIRGLRELTSIPLDLHLMIKDPEYKLPWIGIHKEDIVTIHYESTFYGVVGCEAHNSGNNLTSNHKRWYAVCEASINHEISRISYNCGMKSRYISHKIVETISCNISCSF